MKTTAIMSVPVARSAHLIRSDVCRQCLSQQFRRSLLSTTTPSSKHQLHTRSYPSAITATRKSSSPSLRHPSNAQQLQRGYKTVQEAKSRAKSGPFSWKSGALFVAVGVGLTLYFRYEKARMARVNIAEQNKGIGRPLVGGAFHLVDHNGKDFTEQTMKGKYTLVYFGFTHCPDICPEELDKMAGMIDRVKEQHGNVMRPIFISCDPARDTPDVIKVYLKEFHEDILGMTGTWQEVKDVCKAYRVYFSTPADVKPGQDYLVDHSIYFYLMDPDGDFVEAIGRNFTVDAAAKVINDHIADWRSPLDRT